jgi:hypothetical protein
LVPVLALELGSVQASALALALELPLAPESAQVLALA